MARRRPFRRPRPMPVRKSLEWIGFRSGGTPGNLNTSISHELLGPAAQTAIVIVDATVLRVVGMLGFTAQSGVTSGTAVGAMLFKANVGSDDTIDADVPPLSTDVDDFDNPNIMWWQTWQSVLAPSAAADFDEVAFHVPLDITVKRKLSKRDTLVLRVDALTTGRTRVTVNLRTLIRTY